MTDHHRHQHGHDGAGHDQRQGQGQGQGDRHGDGHGASHDHHQHGHGHGHGQGHGASHDDDGAGWAELLDLDADVFRDLLGEVTGWLADRVGDPPRRILDLGAGTGAGTLALARRFPHAEVTAVDASGALLARLAGKARDLGLAGRIHTVEADLDTAWPAVGTVDLAWASASMHHMADPDRVLGEVFSVFTPAGSSPSSKWTAFPASSPTASVTASKRAAVPSSPRRTPRSCRTSAPIGSRR